MSGISQRKAGVILNYTYLGINSIANLLYVPILLSTIGASQYGLYQTIGSVVSYLAILGNGLGSTLTRYYSMACASADRERRCSVVLSVATKAYAAIALVVLAMGATVLLCFDDIFGESFTPYEVVVGKQMMVAVVINAVMALPGSIFTALVTAEERFIFAQSVNVARAIVQPAAIVAVVVLQGTAFGIVLAQLVVNAIVIAINAWYCFRKLNLSFDLRHRDKHLLLEMMKFTFFVLLGLIFDQVLWRTDQVILGAIYGTEVVALYSIGTTIVSAYIMFSNSVSGILLPKVSKMIEAGESTRALSDLFARVGCIQSVIVGLIETGFALFGVEFIALWAGDEYTSAYLVVLIFMVGMHLALIQNLGQAILQGKNKQAFKSVVYVCIAVINVVVTIPATISYGYIGCAIVSMACLLIGTGPVINIYYSRVVGLDIVLFFKRVLRYLPAILLPFLVIFFAKQMGAIPVADNWVALCLEIIMFVALYIASVYFLGAAGAAGAISEMDKGLAPHSRVK